MSSAPSPPLLEVRRISKQFAGVRALNDVSMTLQRGEVLAVVGENGAGKSTLMKIVAGVQIEARGAIRPIVADLVAQVAVRAKALRHRPCPRLPSGPQLAQDI